MIQTKRFWGILVLLWAILIALLLAFTEPWAENEPDDRSAVKKIIADLPSYQAQIQQWDVTAAVYLVPKEEPEDWLGKRYCWAKISQPVLTLTNENGGTWCFYTGFDQYVEEKIVEDDENGEKTVTLVIKKRQIEKPPRWENTEKDPESSRYYDVEVSVIVKPGEESWSDQSWYHTYYSSSNFTECKYYFGDAWVDMDKKNRNNDQHIKKWYTDQEMLEAYRRGLELGELLRQLSLEE